MKRVLYSLCVWIKNDSPPSLLMFVTIGTCLLGDNPFLSQQIHPNLDKNIDSELHPSCVKSDIKLSTSEPHTEKEKNRESIKILQNIFSTCNLQNSKIIFQL